MNAETKLKHLFDMLQTADPIISYTLSNLKITDPVTNIVWRPLHTPTVSVKASALSSP